jgi:hypothetical protein
MIENYKIEGLNTGGLGWLREISGVVVGFGLIWFDLV